MAKTKSPKGYKVRKMGEILTARPDGMDFETYRILRKEQNKRLRFRLRSGFMVWKSKCIGITNKDGSVTMNGESWGTLVGPVPKLVFVD